MKVLAVIDIDSNSHAFEQICKIYDVGEQEYWDDFIAEAIANIQYRHQLSKVEEFNQVHLKALFELLIKQGVLTTQGLQLDPLIMHSVEKHYAQTKYRWSWRKKKQKQLEEKYQQASSAFQSRVRENLTTRLALGIKNYFLKSPKFRWLINLLQKFE